MKRSAAKCLLCLLLICLVLMSLAESMAATGFIAKKTKEKTAAVKLPEQLTAAEIDAFIAKLNDAQVRQVLIAQLKKMSVEQPDSVARNKKDYSGFAQFWLMVQDMPVLLSTRLKYVLSGFGAITGDLLRGIDRLSDGKGLGRWIIVVLIGVVVILFGFIIERLFRRITVTVRKRLDTGFKSGEPVQPGHLMLGILIELISIGVFFGASMILLALIVQDIGAARRFIAALLLALLMVRLVSLVLRGIRFSAITFLNLLPVGEDGADCLYRGVRLMAIIGIFGATTCLQFRLLGIHEEVYLLMQTLVGMAVALIPVWMIWRRRQHIARLFHADTLPGSPTLLEGQFAQIWHVLAVFYVFCVWAFWEIDLLLAGEGLGGPIFITLLIIPAFMAVIRISRKLLNILLIPKQIPEDQTLEAESGEADEQSTMPETGFSLYLSAFQRSLQLLLTAVVILYLLKVWGVALPLGAAVTRSVYNILVALFLAHVAWEFTKAAIDKRLAATQDRNGEGLEQVSGGTRIGTLLSLLRNFLLIVLLVMVTMIVLSSIGVNIGPLLAGAGVIGLAIGFGAQSLVRDIFSGVFFLIDDAFRIGDFIETGGMKGMVEHISIRSLRIRHPRGMVTTMPFGGLKSVTNFTRDWIVMKLDFRVPYDTDIDKVRKIIKKIGQQIGQNEEMGPKLLEPIKSQGVRQLEDSAMVMRLKFKTRPGEQFVLRREVFTLLQKAFAENGIRFAHRNVTVHLSSEIDPDNAGSQTGAEPAANKDSKTQALKGAGAAAAILGEKTVKDV